MAQSSGNTTAHYYTNSLADVKAFFVDIQKIYEKPVKMPRNRLYNRRQSVIMIHAKVDNLEAWPAALPFLPVLSQRERVGRYSTLPTYKPILERKILLPFGQTERYLPFRLF